MELKEIEIRKLRTNDGSIEGLPKNPRKISKKKLEQLKKSVQDAPEMLKLRELIAVESDDGYVVICGNQRLEAAKALGMETLPVKVLPKDTDPAKLREYAIKDNLPFGEDDWEVLTTDWDVSELEEWGMEVPQEWNTDPDLNMSEDEVERKKREFEEKMKAGEIGEDDEEYQEFLEKFKLKKTTDDCYTPDIVYEAVADYVSDTYKIDRKHFERPFYPSGDYQNEEYPSGCVVVDNPPFSILAEILKFYTQKRIKFFLFAPTLTLFSSSSAYYCALPCGVAVTYENGANVNTSFLTNLEEANVRVKSCPKLYEAIKTANDKNLREMHRELPKYSYPDYIITAPRMAQFSRYGIDFVVPITESEAISQLDSQRASGKTIYGKGYIVSERIKRLKEKAEREKAEREKAERWELSPREMEIVRQLGGK